MSQPQDHAGGNNGSERILDERFADWVDGRLSPEQVERLEAELATDDELRMMADEYRATVAALRQHLAAEEPPLAIADAVMARLPATRAPRRWVPVFASLSAAAAMIILVVVLQDWTSLPSTEEPVVQVNDSLLDAKHESDTKLVAGKDFKRTDRPVLDLPPARAEDEARSNQDADELAAKAADDFGKNARLQKSQEMLEESKEQAIAKTSKAATPALGAAEKKKPDLAKAHEEISREVKNELLALSGTGTELESLARFHLKEVVTLEELRRPVGRQPLDRLKGLDPVAGKTSRDELERDAVTRQAKRLFRRKADDANKLAPKPTDSEGDRSRGRRGGRAGGAEQLARTTSIPVLVLQVPAGVDGAGQDEFFLSKTKKAKQDGAKTSPRSLVAFIQSRQSQMQSNVVPATPIPVPVAAGELVGKRTGPDEPIPADKQTAPQKTLAREPLSGAAIRRNPYRRQATDRVYVVTGDQAQIRQFFVEFKEYLQVQQQAQPQEKPSPRIPMQFEQLDVTEALQQQLRAQVPVTGGPGNRARSVRLLAPSQLTFYLVLRSR